MAVELDPEVVEIAKRWFALPSNDARFSVVVKDALRFLEETEKKVKSKHPRQQCTFPVITRTLS